MKQAICLLIQKTKKLKLLGGVRSDTAQETKKSSSGRGTTELHSKKGVITDFGKEDLGQVEMFSQWEEYIFQQ